MKNYTEHMKEFIMMYEANRLMLQYMITDEDAYQDVNEKILDMVIEYIREVNQL